MLAPVEAGHVDGMTDTPETRALYATWVNWNQKSESWLSLPCPLLLLSNLAEEESVLSLYNNPLQVAGRMDIDDGLVSNKKAQLDKRESAFGSSNGRTRSYQEEAAVAPDLRSQLESIGMRTRFSKSSSSFASILPLCPHKSFFFRRRKQRLWVASAFFALAGQIRGISDRLADSRDCQANKEYLESHKECSTIQS